MGYCAFIFAGYRLAVAGISGVGVIAIICCGGGDVYLDSKEFDNSVVGYSWG